MKLSEAIRLGSLLVKEPKAGNLTGCAITMANLATNGYCSISEQDTGAYKVFKKTFPWVVNLISRCPKCPNRHISEGVELIWHLFDFHVMSVKDMTIEQLADYVATVEPPELPEATNVHLRDLQAVESV